MIYIPTSLHTWTHSLFFTLKNQNLIRICQTTQFWATFFCITYAQPFSPAGTGSEDRLAHKEIWTYWGQAKGDRLCPEHKTSKENSNKWYYLV